jgi:hypothetical protein
VRSTVIIARAAIGRIERPAFPAPFNEKGRAFQAYLAQNMRRDREAVSVHGTNATLPTIQTMTFPDPDAISTPPGTSGLSAFELEW